MTRTLSLVQAGGGGSGLGVPGAPPPEWTGRAPRPPADPEEQAVHDVRELMLMELREKVAKRRKVLDEQVDE